MGQVPDPVNWALLVLVGEKWPEGDEDKLRQIAQAWDEFATSLGPVITELKKGTTGVAQNIPQGTTAQSFREFAKKLTDGNPSYLEGLQSNSRQFAKYARQTAENIGYSKGQIIIQLVFLANTLRTSFMAGPAAPAVAAAGYAAARGFIRLILTRLAKAVLQGVAFQVATDVAVQGAQMLLGKRQEWDWSKTGGAALIGVTGGVIGGLGGMTLSKMFPDFMGSRLGSGLFSAAVETSSEVVVNKILSSDDGTSAASASSGFVEGFLEGGKRPRGGPNGGAPPPTLVDLKPPDLTPPDPSTSPDGTKTPPPPYSPPAASPPPYSPPAGPPPAYTPVPITPPPAPVPPSAPSKPSPVPPPAATPPKAPPSVPNGGQNPKPPVGNQPPRPSPAPAPTPAPQPNRQQQHQNSPTPEPTSPPATPPAAPQPTPQPTPTPHSTPTASPSTELTAHPDQATAPTSQQQSSPQSQPPPAGTTSSAPAPVQPAPASAPVSPAASGSPVAAPAAPQPPSSPTAAPSPQGSASAPPAGTPSSIPPSSTPTTAAASTAPTAAPTPTATTQVPTTGTFATPTSRTTPTPTVDGPTVAAPTLNEVLANAPAHARQRIRQLPNTKVFEHARFDARRVQHNGEHITALTVRLHVDPTSLSPDALAELRAKVQESVHQTFTAPRHRLPSGDLLTVTVEWVDRADDPSIHHTISIVGRDTAMHQLNWHADAPTAHYAHEIGHMIGLVDEHSGHHDAPGRTIDIAGNLMGRDAHLNPELRPRHLEVISQHIGDLPVHQGEQHPAPARTFVDPTPPPGTVLPAAPTLPATGLVHQPTGSYDPSPAQVTALSGFVLVPMPADGNCFYHALNRVLPPNAQRTPGELRTDVVNALAGNLDAYKGFFTSDVNPRAQVDQLRQPGMFNNFAGDLVPLVAAQVYGLTLVVVTPDGTPVTINPDPTGARPPVHLVQVEQNGITHFHVAVPNQPPAVPAHTSPPAVPAHTVASSPSSSAPLSPQPSRSGSDKALPDKPLPDKPLPDKPSLLPGKFTPQYLTDSRSLGRAMVVKAQPMPEILAMVREQLPPGQRAEVEGLAAIEDLVTGEFVLPNEFDTILDQGRSFRISAGKDHYEVTITAELHPARPQDVRPDPDGIRTKVDQAVHNTRTTASTSTDGKPTSIGISATVGVGPGLAVVGATVPLPTPTVSNASGVAVQDHANIRGGQGSEQADTRATYTVTVTAANGRQLTPGGRKVSGQVTLAVPLDVSTLVRQDTTRPAVTPSTPDWGNQLGYFAPEVMLPAPDAFAKVAKLLDPASVAIGSPGRVELKKFLSANNLRAIARPMSRGWVGSPELTSIGGGVSGVLRARTTFGAATYIGPISPDTALRLHQTTTTSDVSSGTVSSGADVKLGGGAGGAIGPAQLSATASVEAGFRNTTTAPSGGGVSSKHGVHIKAAISEYRVATTVEVQADNGRSTTFEAETTMLMTDAEAAQFSLYGGDGPTPALFTENGKDDPTWHLPASGPSAHSTVMRMNGIEQVQHQVEQKLRAMSGDGKLLPDFGTGSRTRWNPADLKLARENQRVLDTELSKAAVATQPGSLFQSTVPVRLHKRNLLTNEYFTVEVKAVEPAGGLSYLGKVRDHLVRDLSSASQRLDSSQGNTQGTAVGIEGKAGGQDLGGSASAKYGYQSTTKTTAGPSISSTALGVGTPDARAFGGQVTYEVTITRTTRLRAWARRLNPNSYLVQTRPTTSSETFSVRPNPADPASNQLILLVPESSASKTKPNPATAPATPVTTTMDNPPRISELLTGKKNTITQWTQAELVAGSKEIGVAVREALAEAGHGDRALETSGTAPRSRIDRFVSPENLLHNLKKFARSGDQLKGLRFNRPSVDRVGAVGLDVTMTNARIVSLSDSAATETSHVGGYTVSSTKTTSHGPDVGIGLGGTKLNPGAPVNGLLSGGLKYGRRTVTTATTEKSGSIERNFVTPGAGRTVLVQVDVRVRVVAESTVRNAAMDLVRRAERSVAGREVTIERGALLRMTEQQAIDQGLLPSLAERAPRSELAPPATLRPGVSGSIGLGRVEQAPDLRHLIGSMRGKLGTLGAELLPDSVLDDAMSNWSRANTLTSQDGVTALIDSALDGGAPLLLHTPNAQGYRLVLSAEVIGDPTLTELAADGRALENYASTKNATAQTAGRERKAAAGLTGGITGSGVTSGSDKAGGTGTVGLNAGRQQGQSSTNSTARQSSNFAIASGPTARYQVPVRFTLTVMRGGSELTSVHSDPEELVIRVAADDQSTAASPAPARPADPKPLPPSAASPKAIDTWRQGGAELPYAASIESFRGAGALRKAGLDTLHRAGDSGLPGRGSRDRVGGMPEHAVSSGVTPEMVKSYLPEMLGRKGYELPSVHDGSLVGGKGSATTVYAKLTNPRLVAMSDSVSMETPSSANIGVSNESSHTESSEVTFGMSASGSTPNAKGSGTPLEVSVGTAETAGVGTGTVAGRVNNLKPDGRTGLVQYDVEFLVVTELRSRIDVGRRTPQVAVSQVRLPDAVRSRVFQPDLAGLVGPVPDRVLTAQDAVKAAEGIWSNAEKDLRGERTKAVELLLGGRTQPGHPDGVLGDQRAVLLEAQARVDAARAGWAQAKKDADRAIADFADGRPEVTPSPRLEPVQAEPPRLPELDLDSASWADQTLAELGSTPAEPGAVEHPTRPAPDRPAAVDLRTFGGSKDFQRSLQDRRITVIENRVVGPALGQRAAGAPPVGFVATVPATPGDDLVALVRRYQQGFGPGAASGRFAMVLGVNGYHGRSEAVGRSISDFARYWEQHGTFPVAVVGFTWWSSEVEAGRKEIGDQKVVPYGVIRELLARNPQAEDLVGQIRDAGSDSVYLHVGDSDVHSMVTPDGVPLFDAMAQQVAGRDPAPEFVSGGYVLPASPSPAGGLAVQAASLDLAVRSAMANVDPRSVYLPEPNLFVQVGTKLENDVTFGTGDQEGRRLVDSVYGQRSFRWADPKDMVLFDPALAVTTDGDRIARKVEQHLDTPLRAVQALTQSHANPDTWKGQLETYLNDHHGLTPRPAVTQALTALVFDGLPPTSGSAGTLSPSFEAPFANLDKGMKGELAKLAKSAPEAWTIARDTRKVLVAQYQALDAAPTLPAPSPEGSVSAPVRVAQTTAPTSDMSWRHSRNDTAEWFAPRDPMPPSRWESRRDTEPVVVNTEVADVQTRSTIRIRPDGRPQLTLHPYISPVRYDLRRIKVESDRVVQDYTVKVQLRRGSGAVTAEEIAQLKQRAVDGVNSVLNQGYRLPSGDQFHVNVEFVDDPGQAHATVEVMPDSDPRAIDQDHWKPGASAAVFAHEVLHYLGVGDDGHDPRRVFLAKPDNGADSAAIDYHGLMGKGLHGDRPDLKPRHLWMVERTAIAQGALPELRHADTFTAADRSTVDGSARTVTVQGRRRFTLGEQPRWLASSSRPARRVDT